MNKPSNTKLRELAGRLARCTAYQFLGSDDVRLAAKVIYHAADLLVEQPKERETQARTIAIMRTALEAIKIRIHFIGMPQESTWTDGCRKIPDWRKEIELLEQALTSNVGKPEEPKVESLREASARLWPVETNDLAGHIADMCALVLRRVDNVLELMQHEFKMSGRTRSSIERERAEIAQMREGCDE